MVRQRRTIFSTTSSALQSRRRNNIPKDPLPDLLRESDAPLYSITTVFPFVLFADKIIIRINHIDVIQGVFFASSTSTRIQIPDIRQVIVNHNPFFAELEIIPQGPLEQTLRVNYLLVNHAMKAKRIITGLLESHQQKVNFSQYNHHELVSAMESLGKARDHFSRAR